MELGLWLGVWAKGRVRLKGRAHHSSLCISPHFSSSLSSLIYHLLSLIPPPFSPPTTSSLITFSHCSNLSSLISQLSALISLFTVSFIYHLSAIISCLMSHLSSFSFHLSPHLSLHISHIYISSRISHRPSLIVLFLLL